LNIVLDVTEDVALDNVHDLNTLSTEHSGTGHSWQELDLGTGHSWHWLSTLRLARALWSPSALDTLGTGPSWHWTLLALALNTETGTGTLVTVNADTGTMDTGSLDTGSPDTGSMDTGSMDTGAGSLDLGSLIPGTLDPGTGSRHWLSTLRLALDTWHWPWTLGMGLLALFLGNLLHLILALLPGGGETLPGAGAGALLIINILGEGGKLVLPELIRKVITNLAWRVDIRTLLLGSGTATPGVSSMFGHWRWSWSS